MKTINDIFSKVVVINLDRRPDRYRSIRAQLDLLGIRADRFAAVDGRDCAVAAEWKRYAASPLTTPPTDRPPISSYRQFYLGDEDELARVAFVEQRDGKKAIATPGAWGLLLSMTKVIERALLEELPSLLLLEDDALFHKDTTALFDHVLGQLPADWVILQLGAMQLHWEPSWITWYSKNLYKCNGSSMAAHAVGLKREVLPMLLEACRRRDLPFDIGALHAVKRRYRDRNFTCFPNLVIQDATDTEIGMSTIFFREARREGNIYRWRISDYGLDALKAQADHRRRAKAPVAGRRAARFIAGPIRRAQAWLQDLRARPESRSLPAATAPGPPVSPGLASSDRVEAPLVPFFKDRPNVRVVMVLAVDVDVEQLPRLLELVAETTQKGDFVPVVVTDYADFIAFRNRGLIFEYIPAEARQQAFAADLEWSLYVLRRLAFLRHKWRPMNTIAFGGRAAKLLHEWQASPLWD
jgi:GR25 family glycosyltransferase involved in LPS biosynthesis